MSLMLSITTAAMFTAINDQAIQITKNLHGSLVTKKFAVTHDSIFSANKSLKLYQVNSFSVTKTKAVCVIFILYHKQIKKLPIYLAFTM